MKREKFFSEIWYCRKDLNPKPNLQEAYWSRLKIQGFKEKSRFLKPEGKTWASHWMKANSALLGREDDQKFTGRHDKYGPFSTEELDITELNNETYESIRDGPISEMSPREVLNRDGDVDEEGERNPESGE